MPTFSINHQTDINLYKDPQLSHKTDVVKISALPLYHRADAFRKPRNTLSHQTDVFKFVLHQSSHSTDCLKVKNIFTIPGVGGQEGIVLAASEISQKPIISKNISTYIDIGSGLSVIVGYPRIPTWNTAGRPKNVKAGTIGFNIETRCLEFWDGDIWGNISTEET